jgi:hypothetical protein
MTRERWWLRWGGAVGCLLMILSTLLVLGLLAWALNAVRP